MANISDFTTCITLNSQPCMIGAALIDLNPDECNQGFCYYPFMANLDTCSGSCNTLDNPSRVLQLPKHISCNVNKTYIMQNLQREQNIYHANVNEKM